MSTFQLIIFFLFTSLSLSAQVYNEKDFPGQWELYSRDFIAVHESSKFVLDVEENTLKMKHPFDEVVSEWKFSKNKTEIYSSNEVFDEEWKILKLDSKKLIVKDQGVVLEFKKIKEFNNPKKEKQDLGIISSVELEKESQLIGDWVIYESDNKFIKNTGFWLSFRPKGSMIYHGYSFNTPATWRINTDAKSIIVEAYNGLIERWDIIKIEEAKIDFRCNNQIISLKRK